MTFDPKVAEKVDLICDQLRKIANESLAEVQQLLDHSGLSRSARRIDEARSDIHNAVTKLRGHLFDYGRNTGLSEAALLADSWAGSGEGSEDYHNLAKAIRGLWR